MSTNEIHENAADEIETEAKRSTVAMNINWPNFDFNIADMTWLKRQYEKLHGPKASKLADTLRWWGAERSAGTEYGVTYNSVIETVGNAGKGPYESEAMYFSPVNNTFARLIVVSLNSSAYDEQYDSAAPVEPKELLTVYDKALAAAKADMDSTLLAAHTALRSRISEAVSIADKAGVRANVIDVFFNEAGRKYVLTITLKSLPYLTSFIELPEVEVSA